MLQWLVFSVRYTELTDDNKSLTTLSMTTLSKIDNHI